MGLVEKPFQLVQLLQGEIRPAPPLLDFRLPFVFHRFRILLALLQLWGHWARHSSQSGGAGGTGARPVPSAPGGRGDTEGAPRGRGNRERGLCARAVLGRLGRCRSGLRRRLR